MYRILLSLLGVEFGTRLTILLKYLQAARKSPEQCSNLKDLGIVKTTSHVGIRKQDIEVWIGVGMLGVFQGEDRCHWLIFHLPGESEGTVECTGFLCFVCFETALCIV